MKFLIKFIQILIPLLVAFSANSQSAPEFEYRKVENNAWETGEILKYRIFYESLLTGQVNAGTAEIEVKKSNRKFDGREVHHIVGTGKSNRTFDFFFKVRDRFETYVDKEAIAPHHFIRRTKEGGYVRDDDVDFNHKNATATSRKKNKANHPLRAGYPFGSLLCTNTQR